MPRKVFHGVDYDEDYDYDDYDGDDYDYDYEEPKTFEAPEQKQETSKSGVWSCPICTFDNEESMSSCDICGVLRNPLVKVPSNSDQPSVDVMRKGTGASVMAKSLFASLPCSTAVKSVPSMQQNDGFLPEESKSLQKSNQIDIVPFKFNSPSPDDLVLRGLFPKEILKDKPSKVKGKKIATESLSDPKISDLSSVSRKAVAHNTVTNDIHPSVNGNNRGNISESLGNMTLTAEPGPSRSNIAGKQKNSHYKPEKWMLPGQGEEKLIQLNLAVVGHVDSGKSTLSGRLLHLLGIISQKQMHKYEKDAKAEGKGSFAYAWALDESAEERERGITMTVGVAYFNSKKYRVVLLDSPGHKDFVPNMISGATQADAAILVIDSSIGSFEAGIDINGGQTREHAQLIRSFGVDQLIVAINKMDVVGYSKERFGIIKQQLGAFLHSCGFKDSSISWVPLSAIENQNLVSFASDGRLSSWYKGSPLLDAIDSLQSPDRDYVKPLLMPICDVIKTQSQGQVAVCGKIEAGAIKSGSKVLVMPSGEIGTVRSLERDSESCAIARSGDNVAVCLQGIDGIQVMAGGVLCHPDFPVSVSNKLELKILMLDVATPILIGSQLELHIHHVKEAARVVKILSLLDPKTGKETKKAPRILMAKQRAVIEVAIQEGVCVAEFSSCKALGRVFLRALGRTIAVGVVTRIVKDQ